MNQQELKNILDLHRKWVLGESGGSGADLQGADLQGANLRGADLQGADLQGADLQGANLRGADLREAYLREAYLQGANLRGADLQGANLQGANLQGANLQGANLQGANLQGANLQPIRDDFYLVLDSAKNEALGLYDALCRGNIDGTHYEGECACLVGTIANIRHEEYQKLSIDLKPNSERPSERWFLAIQEGDIPQSNPISEITGEWMREWMTKNNIKFPAYEITAIYPEDKDEIR